MENRGDRILNSRQQLERELAERLTDGPMESGSTDADAEHGMNVQKLRQRLAFKYEIRVRTERDPIVEETRKYRQIAKELDNRYDRFAAPADIPEPPGNTGRAPADLEPDPE